MPISVAHVFVFIILRPQVFDAVTKHLIGVVFIEHEKDPRVLALMNQRGYHKMRVVGNSLPVLVDKSSVGGRRNRVVRLD